MLTEFSIEFLGRAGIGKRRTENRVVVGLSMGDYVYTKCFVIHPSHRDEHCAAGEKRHEFNERGTPLSWRVRVLSPARAKCVNDRENGLIRLGQAPESSRVDITEEVLRELEEIRGRGYLFTLPEETKER
jgi:hypothetical protein